MCLPEATLGQTRRSGCYFIDPFGVEQLRYNRFFGTFRSIIDC